LRLAGGAPSGVTTSDTNGDGRPDLTMSFTMSSLTQLNASSTSANLSGALFSSQAIVGSDLVTIVSSPGPTVTIANDGSGFCQTLNHDKALQSFTLASCVTGATDRCGNALAINTSGSIIKIQADEAKAQGNDMFINGSSTFQLRRNRDGNGNGRVYTVWFSVTDASGNATTSSFRIQVPLNFPPNGTNAIDSGVHACIGACP
jgi:hypothetical protein